MSGVGRLRHRVGARIVEHALWSPGDRVAVAVSGGLDSVSLLDLLVETASWHGARLSVVTIDHGARPGSSDDAAFVEALAGARGLACVRADLALGPSSEAQLRRARYGVLDALEVDRVALAHHADDQAETVLMHLVRGTGTTGLSGMSWRRGRYVRPLLATRRAEVEAWAAHRGLEHREDPTNDDPAFLRNRVRREVLPLLEALRPGATGAIARSAALAAADDALLTSLVDPPEGDWPLSWVRDTPEPLVRRALLARLPGVGASHLDAVMSAARRGSGRIELPGGGEVTVEGERLRICAGALDPPLVEERRGG